jgi:hypothetical protein
MQPTCRALPGAWACIAAVMLQLTITACSSLRESHPDRTATEQLLISTAAERAADSMARTLPPRGVIFLQPANFDSEDGRYALAAIRDALLRQGLNVVDNRGQANTVIEVRAGALSIDDSDTLVGLPRLPIPIPLAETMELPEVALFSRDQAQGVAQFSAAAYDSGTGTMVASTGPHFGFADVTEWTVLVLFSWTTDDLPDESAPKPADVATGTARLTE